MMIIRNLFLGGTRSKAQSAESAFDLANERLREMEARRERMRKQLEEALREIIEEKKR